MNTIKTFKAYTPTRRTQSTIDFSMLSKVKPCKNLITQLKCANGRNNQGRITIRHKGGGHKKLYRIIDFKRTKNNIEGIVKTIEYDPNRNAFISLINYRDGDKRYILSPHKILVGDRIEAGSDIPLTVGNSLPLKNIPIGTEIHNLEIYPGKGGQLIRAAGTFASLVAKEKAIAIIKLPSKELRIFQNTCRATIGRVGNVLANLITIGKAGRNRWLGVRPTVRGSAMNPIDHPHGGGEGRSPIGKAQPKTPWGKAALGVKTRKNKKPSDQFIISKRKK